MPFPLKSRIASGFSRSASRYDYHASLQREATELLLPTILPYLDADAALLDLGCGTGYLGRLLSDLPVSYRLFQLDIAFGMCRAASFPSHPHHHIIQGDIEQLPICPQSMSVISSSMAFQWLTDLPSVFSHIKTLLKPGGIFACILVTDGSLYELTDTFKAHGMSAPINHFPSCKQLEDALKAADMEDACMERRVLTTDHPSLLALLDHFKQLGAPYIPITQEGRSPLSRGYLRTLDAYYRQKHGKESNMLRATWNLYRIEWVHPLSA